MSDADDGTGGPGTLVVSLDAELGWGFHHHDDVPTRRIARARVAWKRLLDLFDEFDAATTWAVVGHLFRDACDGDHADHPAGPAICRTDAEWLSASDVWFADGLVDAIRRADADHEVAGHGFTHVHFNHDRMSRSLARREIAAVREAAAGRDYSLSSFVFPVNEVAHCDLLADHGFACYRGVGPADANRRRWRARKVQAAVLDRTAPPLVEPHVDEHGLVNVPASLYLFDGLGPLSDVVGAVRDDPVVAWAQRGIDAAVERGGVLHLWCHPHNFTDETDFERVTRILAHAARERDRGNLRVETMADVAARETEDADP